MLHKDGSSRISYKIYAGCVGIIRNILFAKQQKHSFHFPQAETGKPFKMNESTGRSTVEKKSLTVSIMVFEKNPAL